VVVSVLLNPTSRKSSEEVIRAGYSISNIIGGTIKLKSSNPFDKPLIDPNYLTTDMDIFAMRESVKSINRFVGQPALADYVVSRFGNNFASADDDSTIDAYVRSLTTTIFHPVGTAAIAPRNSNNGVVNPDLTVKGADGLRVVDASVFVSLSLHLNSPLFAQEIPIAIRSELTYARPCLPSCGTRLRYAQGHNVLIYFTNSI